MLPTLIRLNPLVGIIDMYRWVFLGMPVYDGDLVKGVVGAVAHPRVRLLVLPLCRVAVRTSMMAEPTAETAVATAVPKLTIRVRDLVLDYEVFEDRRAALRQRLVTKQGTGRSLVHALKGVSFDAAEGDAIGVVGPNGSGKSTLLAALAGLLPPTSGEILVAEEPKLLGVGATLHRRRHRLPQHPARVPGARHVERRGRRPDRRDRRVHRLGEAINRPLRTYSSGMRARLHFAIATSVQAADPAHRRGARGRRQGVPGEVDGTHRGDRLAMPAR